MTETKQPGAPLTATRDLLLRLVNDHIERESATSSFMVRAGLLRDVLQDRADLHKQRDELLAALDDLADAAAEFGKPIPALQESVANARDLISRARGEEG